jgi:hypothetical protein
VYPPIELSGHKKARKNAFFPAEGMALREAAGFMVSSASYKRFFSIYREANGLNKFRWVELVRRCFVGWRRW